jgi:hypothetical protein
VSGHNDFRQCLFYAYFVGYIRTSPSMLLECVLPFIIFLLPEKNTSILFRNSID